MNKILSSETIVPEQFYVERKADIQLEQVLNHMGRPASVLVSRQMGKTNLLLHTINKLKNNDFVFVYVDLSTSENDLRMCFRNIIDTAIDTNSDVFDNAFTQINLIRAQNRSPLKEHEQELLYLLKQIKGRLVLILDEIDSMTNFDFSDQFFSQIRSIYFAGRQNYPNEFKRLTYVLSGVLEPSEIVKDKNKSPFNISEKIYLNDFNHKEYLQFINNINFNFINNDVIERIYFWAKGHPRMTWDICSKLEDLYYEKNFINSNDVDYVVTNLYIKHSDTPPIDHVKTLVAENKNIAQIILDISQGIYLNISDDLRNKLYLYGIIEVNDEQQVKIKNKILEENLNEKFLRKIIYSELTPFEIAEEYFQKEKYNEAIVEYSRFLQYDQILPIQKNVTLINAGLCWYHLGEYDRALGLMNQVSVKKESDPYNYYINELNKGLCFLALDEYDQSIKVFTNVLESKIETTIIKAHLYIAQAYMQKDKDSKDLFTQHVESAITLLEDPSILQSNSEFYENTLAQTHFLQASFYYIDDEYDKVELHLRKILEISIDEYKPSTLIQLADLELVSDEELESIFSLIQTKNMVPDYFNISKFSVSDIYSLTYHLLIRNKMEILNEFLNYCYNSYTQLFNSKCAILFEASKYFMDIEEPAKAKKILLFSTKFKDKEIAFKDCYKNLYALLVNTHIVKKEYDLLLPHYYDYINLLTDVNSVLTDFDFYVLYEPLKTYIRNGKIRDMIFVPDVIQNKIIPKINSEQQLYKAILLDLLMQSTLDKKAKYDLSQQCYSIMSSYMDQLSAYPEDFKRLVSLKYEHHKQFLSTENNMSSIQSRSGKCLCGSGKKYKQCCEKKKKK